MGPTWPFKCVTRFLGVYNRALSIYSGFDAPNLKNIRIRHIYDSERARKGVCVCGCISKTRQQTIIYTIHQTPKTKLCCQTLHPVELCPWGWPRANIVKQGTTCYFSGGRETTHILSQIDYLACTEKAAVGGKRSTHSV